MSMNKQEESVVFKFDDLALGARFKYHQEGKTWIKLSNCGLIAEYDPEYIKHRNWTGQQICTFADTPEQRKQIEVILME